MIPYNSLGNWLIREAIEDFEALAEKMERVEKGIERYSLEKEQYLTRFFKSNNMTDKDIFDLIIKPNQESGEIIAQKIIAWTTMLK